MGQEGTDEKMRCHPMASNPANWGGEDIRFTHGNWEAWLLMWIETHP